MDPIVVPAGLRPRIGVLVVGAAISLLAGGGLTWALWGRTPPPLIAPPATASVGPSRTPAGLLVHVAGAVRSPGLYELPSSARVADAIEAAGGPTRRADLDLLNLAELLIDGMRVEVFQRGETGAVPSSQSNGSILVSLNSADQVELELVPGIGPVTAVAIIARREEIGGFSSLEELLEVDGIGPVTLESIKPYMKL